MTQKLNLGTALGALVIFFLPWLDFQCQGKSFIQQTGIQTITGKASLAPGFESLAKNQGNGGKNDTTGKDGPKSVLAALALIAIVGAIIAALLSLRSATGGGNNLAGVLCAIALGLLVVQAAIGFPAARDLEEKMRTEQSGNRAEDPLGQMASAAVASTIQTKYFPAFYFELALLGLPTLLLCNGLLDRMRKSPG